MTIARSITVQLQQLISVEFLNLCSSASLVVPLVTLLNVLRELSTILHKSECQCIL